MKTGIRGAINVAAFFAGIGLGLWVLKLLVPPLWVPEYSEKLAHIAQHPKSYDILFIGSSRVRRQISPRVFDAALREKGWKGHSFNFGMDGLGYPEMLYLVDQLLSLDLPHVRYVFIELTRFGRDFGPLSQPDSKRMIQWHTPKYTAMICQAIWEDPETPTREVRLERMQEHLSMCWRREFNAGRGAELLVPSYEDRPAVALLGPEGDGFFPVRMQFPSAQREAYRRQVAEQSVVISKPPLPEALFEKATEEMVEKLRRRGIIPVIITVPRIYPSAPWVPALEAASPDGKSSPGIVLRFDDPKTHPELFDPRYHYDAQHLNSDGAELFSRELAEEFWGRMQAR